MKEKGSEIASKIIQALTEKQFSLEDLKKLNQYLHQDIDSTE